MYGPISEWDVSNAKDMNEAFAETNFNENIGRWDVSNVTYMNIMFTESSFNQPIGQWDVSNLKIADRMFSSYENEDDNLEEWAENIKELQPVMEKCSMVL